MNFAGLIHPGLIGCLPDPEAAGDLEQARDGADRDQPDARARRWPTRRSPPTAHAGQAEGRRARPRPRRRARAPCRRASMAATATSRICRAARRSTSRSTCRAAGCRWATCTSARATARSPSAARSRWPAGCTCKVEIIKDGMAKYGIKNPIFKPSPITPNYNDYLIFEGISVDEAGQAALSRRPHRLPPGLPERDRVPEEVRLLRRAGLFDPRHGAVPGPHLAAWSTSPTPAPRCGCRRRSSTSTSCRRRRVRPNTSRATSRCRCHRTNSSPRDGMRDGAYLPPRIRRCESCNLNRARKRNARLRISLQRLRPVHRHAADGRVRRAAGLSAMRRSSAPRVILTAPNFFCMPSDKRKAHATNERSCQRAENRRRIQGLARRRAAAAARSTKPSRLIKQDQKRRQGLSRPRGPG